MERVERPVARITGVIEPSESLSSAEASRSRALGKKNTRGDWEEGKLKRARNAGKGKEGKAAFFPLPIVPRAPVFSLQRSRSRFFLRCLLKGASAEERASELFFLSDAG